MEAASAMSMDRLFDKIKQLPTIPQLLHELMQSFSDENARIDEIAAKIAMTTITMRSSTIVKPFCLI